VVLSDRSIREELAAGRLAIEPLASDAIQPSSVDLRLDRLFRVFKKSDRPHIDVRQPSDDCTELIEVEGDKPFLIRPGEFVLANTLETITVPSDLVARLDGRSSLGRLGLLVHATAGYVDPGFSGKLTLELANAAPLPIVVYCGMKICQISFLRLTTPVDRPYGSPGLGSKYQGQQEPTPSRVHEDFKRENG
jgi:dCTP deaminase